MFLRIYAKICVTVFMDPDVDPSMLCPWCDEPLPPILSPHLQNLILAARQRSIPDPRPTNPLGLHAPLNFYIAICQRHSFESEQVPLAKKHGWPTSIDWGAVSSRVEKFERMLRRIVEDVDEDFLPGKSTEEKEGKQDDVEEDEELLKHRPRKASTFWKDVTRNVKQKGSRKNAGVKEQLSSFSKTQPGYYGELGYVVIHQTIYDLFPPTSFYPDTTLPLTPTEFIQHILVPEAALALIMEDMKKSRQECIKILRDSAEYGAAMFPDEQGSGEKEAEVVEEIVKKRARKRRKALEDEERSESGGTSCSEESSMDEEEKALWKAVDGDDGQQTEKHRRSNPTEDVMEISDSESIKSVKSTRSTASRKSRAVSKTKDTVSRCAFRSDVEMMAISDSTESGWEVKQPIKPRPRAKKRVISGSVSEPPINLNTDSDADIGMDTDIQCTPRLTKIKRKPSSCSTPIGKENIGGSRSLGLTPQTSIVIPDSDSESSGPNSSRPTQALSREVDEMTHRNVAQKTNQDPFTINLTSDGEDNDRTPIQRRTFSRTTSGSSTGAVVGKGTSVLSQARSRRKGLNE
ncbi:RTC4-like domain-containing protein [Abortiporus biennis]|nr:RTC4-like domain-containing protein [Abortiporus biennis]